jgi:hypothetical protein
MTYCDNLSSRGSVWPSIMAFCAHATWKLRHPQRISTPSSAPRRCGTDGAGSLLHARCPITEFHSLAEVGKRLPTATVCLLSALVFHGITTQIPSEVWVALPRGSRTPRLDNRKLRPVRLSGPALTEGRVQHRVEGVPVMIYSRRVILRGFFVANALVTEVPERRFEAARVQ